MRFPPLLLLLLLPALATSASDDTCNAEDLRSGRPTYLRRVRTVDGCSAFVWRGQGGRVWVEPTFCAPSGLSPPSVRYEPIGGYWYVTLPVMLTNRTLLKSLARELDHLKPKFVRYFHLAEVHVKVDQADPLLGGSQPRFPPRSFVWSQSEDVGLLRLGCGGIDCYVLQRLIADDRIGEVLETLSVFVTLTWPCGRAPVVSQAARLVSLQGATLEPLWSPDVSRSAGTESLPACQGLRATPDEVLDVGVGNSSCRLRLHRAESSWLAEPLLCFAGEARLVHDFNRRARYLSLGLALRSEAALAAARAAKPGAAVAFARLLSPGLESGLVGLDLRLATDGGSLRVRIRCDSKKASDTPDRCNLLLTEVQSDPLSVLSRIKWRPTIWVDEATSNASMDGCRLVINETRLSVPLSLTSQPLLAPTLQAGSPRQPRFPCSGPWAPCQFVRLQQPQGRTFLVAQQRLSSSVQFDRNWTDYESGFGDEHNFWIGLRNMAALTGDRGLGLRLEAKLWNGTELIAEYSRFRLIGSRYNLTYASYMASSLGLPDPLNSSRGAQFSTRDRPAPIAYWRSERYYYTPDGRYLQYSGMQQLGNAGWWWSNDAIGRIGQAAQFFNPNGIFHYGDSVPRGQDVRAFLGLNMTVGACGDRRVEWRSLKEVRLLLEI